MSVPRRRMLGALLLAACSGRGLTRAPRSTLSLVCGRGPTVDGVDVSEHQGVVDCSAVRASGRRFAIARVGLGSRADTTFARNWAGMRAAGLLRGAYLYVLPEQDPVAQATLLVRAVGRLGPGDLPPALDVEKLPPGVPPAVYAARLAVLVARVRRARARTHDLVRRGTLARWVQSEAFAALPLWHPQYADVRCPSIAHPWRAWTFWQTSGADKVPGVRRRPRCLQPGDLAALEGLAGGGRRSTPGSGRRVAQPRRDSSCSQRVSSASAAAFAFSSDAMRPGTSAPVPT
ncbi:MAG: glycoside hydrolase family 25 protein [Polyangiales bacterium]